MAIRIPRGEVRRMQELRRAGVTYTPPQPERRVRKPRFLGRIFKVPSWD